MKEGVTEIKNQITGWKTKRKQTERERERGRKWRFQVPVQMESVFFFLTESTPSTFPHFLSLLLPLILSLRLTLIVIFCRYPRFRSLAPTNPNPHALPISVSWDLSFFRYRLGFYSHFICLDVKKILEKNGDALL